jgi:hypothetical protein
VSIQCQSRWRNPPKGGSIGVPKEGLTRVYVFVREVSRPKRIYATGGKILEEPAAEGQKQGRCLLKYCPCTGRNALRHVIVNEDIKTALALGYSACDLVTESFLDSSIATLVSPH